MTSPRSSRPLDALNLDRYVPLVHGVGFDPGFSRSMKREHGTVPIWINSVAALATVSGEPEPQ